MDGKSTVLFLRQFQGIYEEKPMGLFPGLLEPTQRCKVVTEKAAELGIELLFLLPYSPNLNLIERLWKFVKKQVLYSKYYEKFEDFKAAITKCLEQSETKHKEALDSLLKLNFQTFSETKVIAL
jgi:transposase